MDKKCQVYGKSSKDIFRCLFSTQLTGMPNNAWNIIGIKGQNAFRRLFRDRPEGVTMEHVFIDPPTRKVLKIMADKNLLSRTKQMRQKIAEYESQMPTNVSMVNQLTNPRDTEGLLTPKIPTELEPNISKYLKAGKKRTKRRRKTNKKSRSRK